jgi:thymidine kinase
MEPHVLRRKRTAGWIEVICGSMFSGKTEELIRRLKRARIARQQVEIFKPALDTRFSMSDVVSHDANAIPSTSVDSASQIILLSSEADVIGIDEAQFFDNDLVRVCSELAETGKRVIVAGLDQDFMGRPFEPLPQLMAGAEFVTKLHAICVVCGAPANHSQRISGGTDRVELGATDAYEPRCRECFDPTGRKGIASPLIGDRDRSVESDSAAESGDGSENSDANAGKKGTPAIPGRHAPRPSGGSSSQSIDRLVDSE